MYQILLASLGFIPWVIYIIITYYSKNFSQVDHIESASWYGGYLFSVAVIYAIYKIISIITQEKKVKFNFWHIAGFALLQIFIVTISYSVWQNVTTLFLKNSTKAFHDSIWNHAFYTYYKPITLSHISKFSLESHRL